MRIRILSRVAWLAVVGAALAASGCTLDKQEAPSLIGPSGYGLSITMTATPDVLPRDGSSSSVIQLIARDANGKPATGQRFLLSTSGGKLTERDIVTDGAGQKTFGFVAPGLSDNVATAEIFATPVGNNSDNTVDRRVLSIRLLGPGFPRADFTFTPAGPGQFDLVTFDASASLYQGVACGASCTYAWDFGDGSTGSGLLTTHRFETQGIFRVALTVTTPDGTTDTITKNVTVGSARPLTAVILFSPTNPLAGEDVTFDGRSSTTPDGSRIVEYQWDFGNGDTGGGETATTSFPDGRTYLVRLTIRDSAGRTATTTISITPGAVAPPVPPGPLTPVITFSPTTIVIGSPVTFDCRSSSTAPGASISGCQWDFGNGTSGSGVTASATYTAGGTYTVRLIITDSLGRTATTTTAATVGAAAPASPLTPVITFSPINPQVGQTVNVNGLSSTTAAGATITTYQWDFGNGLTATGPSASTSYPSAQTYTIRLTVTDSLGRTETRTTTLTVGLSPLAASFTFSKTDPAPGEMVFVNAATSTTAPGATITSYEWDFGNGLTGTGVSASTSYTTAGTYTVNLKITDSLGRTATTSRTLAVGIPPPPAP
jgi:PKD repeat protein